MGFTKAYHACSIIRLVFFCVWFVHTKRIYIYIYRLIAIPRELFPCDFMPHTRQLPLAAYIEWAE